MSGEKSRERVFYENRSGSIRVTERYFKTPKNTYLLPIARVSIGRHGLFFAVVVAAGLMGFGTTFRDLLYDSEFTVLCGISAAAVLISWCIGTLHVRSVAVNELAVIRPIWTIRRIRDALDRAMNQGRENIGELVAAGNSAEGAAREEEYAPEAGSDG